MDARRRAAAKVGTLARRATQQTLQLTQPNKAASLPRDWSAFVPIEARAVLSSSVPSSAAAEARHKSAPVAHVRLISASLSSLSWPPRRDAALVRDRCACQRLHSLYAP